jgi:N-acyl homoserine lactone hydrolase
VVSALKPRPKILKLGSVSATESILFLGGAATAFRKIGCFAYLLQLETGNVLVDTGINDLQVVNKTAKGPNRWQRNPDEILENQLAKYQLAIGDITTVILTHLHYDHCSNLTKFSNAEIILSAKEWDYVRSPTFMNSVMHQAIQPIIDYLDAKTSSELNLINGDYKLSDQLNIIEAGGHTPGSLMVAATYGPERYLMTGDAVFLIDNVIRNIPIGFSMEPENSRAVLEKLSKYPGKLLTGHDPLSIDILGDRHDTDVGFK